MPGQLFTVPVLGTTPSVSALTDNGLLVSRRNSTVGAAIDNNRQFVASATEPALAGLYFNASSKHYYGICKSAVSQDFYQSTVGDDGIGVYSIRHAQADAFTMFYGIRSDESNVTYTFYYDLFDSYEELITALGYVGSYPITYSDTNCTHTGPTNANVGDTVTVNYSFNTGYGIVNPSTDIYVTNNGVVVPSTYSNGVLTFTMPDPS